MSELWHFLLAQLQNNNFLSGGAVLMAMGGLVAILRNVPQKLYEMVKTRCLIELDIPDRDRAFDWINGWLAVHPYGASRARLLTVKTISDVGDVPDGNTATRNLPRIILSPAPGVHYFFYKGRFVILNRSREEKKSKSFEAFKETFNIKIIGRDRTIAQSLLEDARLLAYPPEDQRLTLYIPHYEEWVLRGRLRPRPIDSVVLRAGLMETMVEAIRDFKSSEKWHYEQGIPHRLGFLFDGPPGTGKSTAALALASYFGMDIATLNLNSIDNDEVLRNYFASVPKNTLLIVEDIDCVFCKRTAREEKKSGVSFSGLLNAIDGVAAGEGRILIMTTNKPWELDAALIRPGRADFRFTIDTPTEEQRMRIFLRFFPGVDGGPLDGQTFAEPFARAVDTQVSMAQIQGHLKKYRHSAENALRFVAEVNLVLSPEATAPLETLHA